MANWKKTLFVSGSAMVDEQGKCSFTACLVCEVKSACFDVRKDFGYTCVLGLLSLKTYMS